MTKRKRGMTGTAWNEQVFTSSAIGRAGGPVRRSIDHIVKYSSKASLMHEAQRRGWLIIQIHATWVLYDARWHRHFTVWPHHRRKKQLHFKRLRYDGEARTSKLFTGSLRK
jgi:hypothetical protein